jgi:hypothetical protein
MRATKIRLPNPVIFASFSLKVAAKHKNQLRHSVAETQAISHLSQTQETVAETQEPVDPLK